jgi:hypothetical protein
VDSRRGRDCPGRVLFAAKGGAKRGNQEGGRIRLERSEVSKDESSGYKIEYIPQFIQKENNARFTKASPTSDMDHAGIVS